MLSKTTVLPKIFNTGYSTLGAREITVVTFARCVEV
jgi:hypothetical protein